MTTNNVPGPANGKNYTAAEIMQILDHAQKLGVTFLKVDGFEATWALEPAVPAAAPEVDHSKPAPIGDGPPLAHQRGWEGNRRPHYDGPRRAAELCNVCRSEKRPSRNGGLYCVQCFIARKEARRGY